MRKLSLKPLLVLSLLSFSAWGLDPYQGSDYPLKSWMCGAPIVEALRKYDPGNLLNDTAGNKNIKESLEDISSSNLAKLRTKVGTLTQKEQDLLDLISIKFPPPIVHRASPATAQLILNSRVGLESAVKRKQVVRGTPVVEQQMFAGHDCLFTSVASPFGIQDYGNVIFRFKDKAGFAWGSMYTGYRWMIEVEKKEFGSEPNSIRRRFAEQVYTNNHWDEALGLFIVDNVRAGSSFRGRGAPFDANLLDKLLAEKKSADFWGTIVHHRLAFLEGHYIDNVPHDDMEYVQFRSADKAVVTSWGLSSRWFSGSDPFIQFFRRDK